MRTKTNICDPPYDFDAKGDSMLTTHLLSHHLKKQAGLGVKSEADMHVLIGLKLTFFRHAHISLANVLLDSFSSLWKASRKQLNVENFL